MTMIDLLVPAIPGVLALAGLWLKHWARNRYLRARIEIAKATGEDPGPIYDGPERRKRPRS